MKLPLGTQCKVLQGQCSSTATGTCRFPPLTPHIASCCPSAFLIGLSVAPAAAALLLLVCILLDMLELFPTITTLKFRANYFPLMIWDPISQNIMTGYVVHVCVS